VLSIDGGGIKGIYSARILEQFEKKFNCCIADYFDLICGTSTGGLIALALSLKIPVSVITNFYYMRGERIFRKRSNIYSLFKQVILGSKYDNQELKTALQEIFADHTLGDSHCMLCIPAFSLTDVKDLTIQSQGGTSTSFTRFVEGNLSLLQNFFQETGYDFTRFNYLGEWHSHPAFVPEPSSTDCNTTWEIVEDSSVGANFVVLMIVRLDNAAQLKGTVTVFLPGHQRFKGTLIQEEMR
jgi:hypothetical protein